MKPNEPLKTFAIGAVIVTVLQMTPIVALSQPAVPCPVTHAQLMDALTNSAPDGADNGGLNNNMWATVINRDGIVCNVSRTGNLNAQWPLSRVISAQKGNTAFSLSLDGGTGGTVDALSTANLWAATQPGGSLWELTQSNPVDTFSAYAGATSNYGTANDPMKGKKVGGVNVFGGGLALYDNSGQIVGGLGVSGDTSCADHNVAWRVRDFLALDNVPSGVGPLGGTVADNIIYDIQPVEPPSHLNFPETISASGFGHPSCGFGEDAANAAIVAACPPDGAASQDCTDLGSN
jgi:uncharacterized protein GlcG (DUF336 family)